MHRATSKLREKVPDYENLSTLNSVDNLAEVLSNLEIHSQADKASDTEVGGNVNRAS